MKTIKILVIEDSPDVFRMLETMLTSAFSENKSVVEIIHSESVKDSVEILLSEKNFDAITSDVNLPDGTSDTIIDILSYDQKNIFVTFSSDEDYRLKRKNNSIPFILKNDYETLVKTLGTIIN